MLFVLIWVIFGFVSSGFLGACFTRKYIGQSLSLWRNTDLDIFLVSFITGPLGICATLGFLLTEDRYWGFRIPFTKITKNEWDKWATAYQQGLYSREWSVYSRSLDEGDENDGY